MQNLSLNENIVFKQIDSFFLVSNPEIGAFSLLREEELLFFMLFYYSDNKLTKLQSISKQLGLSEAESNTRANDFLRKMEEDGWLRIHFPERTNIPLEKVYFSVTKNCNMSCPYCYMGLYRKKNEVMPIFHADRYLDKIKRVNSNCHIVISGGEPFVHADIFNIIQLIYNKSLPFAILTNGTLLTRNVVERLKVYDNLTYIQVSLDGMSREVHNLTRADSYEKTISGIHNLIDFELPFSLAPTIHEGNLHEIYDIAHYAITNGAYFTPNNLRKFPHDSNDTLSLSNDSLYPVIKEINSKLVSNFGLNNLERLRTKNKINFNIGSFNNDKSVCGVAYSVVDVDWNGDVYPCNLLRQDVFKLGNLRNCDFEDIFMKADILGIKTKSYEIPKCKKCELVSICGGGCRAAAFYNYGSFLREDDLCDILYKSNLDLMRIHKGAEHGPSCQ